MPREHDPAPAVPDVPCGHAMLIPGAKLLGIRGARRRPFPPHLRTSHGQDGIGHPRTRLAQCRGLERPPTYVEEIRIREGRRPRQDPLEARIRAQALETPEQARLQRGAIQHLPGGHTMEDVRKPDPEVRFFQNISQTRQRPTPHEFGVHPQ